MIWRKSKIPYSYLLGFITLLVCLIFFAELQATITYDSKYQLKVAGAKKMEQAMTLLREELGTDIDKLSDPNATGFIGVEFSPITTTLGSLVSKRTSTNPDFVPLLIDYLIKAGIKSGDVVAVKASGSFPALNLATLIAIETLEVKPILISSIGASTWGANRENWTWADLENFFFEQGIIHHHSVAIALGGDDDHGEGFWEGGLEIAIQAVERNEIPLIQADGFLDSLEKHLAILESEKPKLFINLGGSKVGLGDCEHSLDLPNGLILANRVKPCLDEQSGLLMRFIQRGIPVIQLLNIPDLAVREGIPLDPIPLPEIGTTPVYFSKHYPWSVIFISLLVLGGYLGWGISLRRDRSDSNPKGR